MNRVLLTVGLALVMLAPPEYPPQWWTPAPKEGAPAWEILPQEAKPGEVILSKRNELGLLSNFAATPFVFRGQRYASLEGFWQMMLYPESAADPRAMFHGLTWKFTRAQVAQMTAFEAKDAGTLAEENMNTMGITWVTFEGKRIDYRPPARRALPAHRRSDTREGAAEPRGQTRAPGDGRSDLETRSSPGAERARGLAVLRNPHRDPQRASAKRSA